MRRKVRVLFYLQNLSGGGAERVTTELFKSYDREKFEYKLLLKNNQIVDYQNIVKSSDFFDQKQYALARLLLRPEMLLQFLCLRLPYSLVVRALLYTYKRIVLRERIKSSVKEYFSEPAVAESLCQGILSFFSIHWRAVFSLNQAVASYCPEILVGTLTETSNALIFLGQQTSLAVHRPIRWVAVEQNNTLRRFADYYESDDQRFWNQFVRIIFGSAEKIITPSEGVKAGLVQHYRVSTDKVAVVYNPVDNASVHRTTPADVAYPFILSAGRLHSQKGFDTLIRSFAKIGRQVDVHLCILGKGKLEPELSALAQTLGVADRVHFLGFQPNLWAYMKVARLFVLSSRYEGFGNVLIEAMASGCPVVSFDCDYGPSEIIHHAEDGWLVADGDEESLAKAIRKLLNDDGLRQKLIRNGVRRALDFDVNKIAQQYGQVIQNKNLFSSSQKNLSR